MTGLPIEQAAAALGVRPGTLRRLCRQGAPHTPGARGRGHALLVDVEQARQWIGAPADSKQLMTLADAVPQLLAGSALSCWQQSEGIDKRKLAGILAAVWYASATVLLDHIREQNPATPDVQNLPPEIERLRKIAHGN